MEAFESAQEFFIQELSTFCIHLDKGFLGKSLAQSNWSLSPQRGQPELEPDINCISVDF